MVYPAPGTDHHHKNGMDAQVPALRNKAAEPQGYPYVANSMAAEPLKVAVYDLNKTLYLKSSKEEFFKYVCFKKGYKLLNLAQLAGLKILGKLRLIDITTFKENFFDYLDHLPPEKVRKYAREYWQIEFPQHFHKELLQEVKELRDQGVKVYIISGGLEVYVRPLGEFLEVDAILGTRACYEDGDYKVDGKACKDEEKYRRLKEDLEGQEFQLVKAYSDEEEHILHQAEEAYLVEDGEIRSYPKPE